MSANQESVYTQFQYPIVRHIDDLSLVDSGALYDLESYNRRCIVNIHDALTTNTSVKKVAYLNDVRRAFEEELCYVQREIQIRTLREMAHREWMKLHADDEGQ